MPVNSAVFLADLGNIGLVTCAAIDTTAVGAYAWKARGRGTHGAWWKTRVGLHLMCFMAAFAIVLDEGAASLIAHWAGLTLPAWYLWVQTLSFAALIPPVLAWRLALILRPPRLQAIRGHDGQGRRSGGHPCVTALLIRPRPPPRRGRLLCCLGARFTIERGPDEAVFGLQQFAQSGSQFRPVREVLGHGAGEISDAVADDGQVAMQVAACEVPQDGRGGRVPVTHSLVS